MDVFSAENCIRRVKRGKGFIYLNPKGRRLSGARLDQIRKLAIPPAYRDVQIAADPSAHLQAVGRDARGRKQYRYHPDWRKKRDEAKYRRIIQFAKTLPKIRRRVRKDLAQTGLPRTKVLAAVVNLLEKTLIRIGNDEYARTNRSYGLSTLQDRHVKIKNDEVTFSFDGKSSVRHRITLHDAKLAKVIKQCRDLPGQWLFQYEDERGVAHAIHSQDVNQYLKEISGSDFTAKDFRTWGGTMFAACILHKLEPCTSTSASKRALNRAIERVATELGNTRAICRKSYIHPRVIDVFLAERCFRIVDLKFGRLTERKLLDFLCKEAGDEQSA